MVFLILILEQNVFRFICRTILEEPITLYRTLESLKNEISKKIVDILSSYIFRNRIFMHFITRTISRTYQEL